MVWHTEADGTQIKDLLGVGQALPICGGGEAHVSMTHDAGEALCYFATKSTPIFPLLECIMLDACEVQLPEHKAWFKES